MACWLVDRADQAGSVAVVVPVVADQVAVVDPARAVAADRAAVKADSADPAGPAQASATASVKAGRIFAA